VSALERKLAAGDLVITAEMPVINGGGLDQVGVQLEPMEPYVDAVNATDNPSARAHAAPLAVAIALRARGVEPIMQLTCRDRNRLALQADIVGAALHGIENICCLTGDDVTAGDEPQTRRVFDLDGPQLVALARTIGAGRYLSGRPIEPAPPLCVGAVENPGAPPHDVRLRRAEKKADAGARFLQLQICYRPERRARARRRGAGGRDRPRRGVRRRARGVLRAGLRAGPPRALTARCRRPALHLVPQGRGHRETVRAAGHPAASGKGGTWIPSSARGLGP
jgi:5,10-methylenetetrahydrofolate reductase